MSEGPARFQVKLHNVFLGTFWIGVACAAITAIPSLARVHENPMLGFTAIFALLAAFWSFKGSYLGVLVTVGYAALFFLLMWGMNSVAFFGRS